MWRYIKSAFLVSADVPALGRVPVNILLASGFVILGFAQPAFWFLGAAVEATLVTALAFNPRFQKYVEAQHLQLAKDDAGSKRQGLTGPYPVAFARVSEARQQPGYEMQQRARRLPQPADGRLHH